MIIDDKIKVNELETYIGKRLYIKKGITCDYFEILEILIDRSGVRVLIPGGNLIRLDKDSVDLNKADLLNRIKQGLIKDIEEVDKELEEIAKELTND